jgi:hypothetical protein
MMLPFRYKIPGVILIISGFIMTILYFVVDFRFELPVFAIFSSYVETKFLTTFKTNFADELILLTLLAGFLLVSFSREKKEEEYFTALRHKALVLTAIINSAILLFSILFIYGGGFMGVVIMNIYTPFIIYIITFHVLKSNLLKSM